jgi:hypothetical protein
MRPEQIILSRWAISSVLPDRLSGGAKGVDISGGWWQHGREQRRLRLDAHSAGSTPMARASCDIAGALADP